MTPKRRSSTYIASVGAFLNSVVMLIGYLADWPAECYPLVAAVVGAGLAVWRSGEQAPPPDQRGYTRAELLSAIIIGALALLAFVGLLGLASCSQVVRKDKPAMVTFDVDRTTCAIWVDVDGRRAFEVNPGPETRCTVAVSP
jgi:hypothetical protein